MHKFNTQMLRFISREDIDGEEKKIFINGELPDMDMDTRIMLLLERET